MTDKPNYSLKDLLNELKEKEKELVKIEERIKKYEIKENNQFFSKKGFNSLKRDMAVCQAEISALKSGISVATKLIEDEIKDWEEKKTEMLIFINRTGGCIIKEKNPDNCSCIHCVRKSMCNSLKIEDRIKYLRGLL
jgi:hypothetical protein